MPRTYVKHPPAFVDCIVHGPQSKATTHLRVGGAHAGEPRHRCAQCHAERERKRRAANPAKYQKYKRARRALEEAQS